ncbi:MAG: hypothetical protein AAGA56_21105 [Myxococcota bacterium]
MKNIYKGLLVFGACLGMATFSYDTTAAGSVAKTKDDCVTAWAILFSTHPTVHGGFQHPEFKDAIMGVVNTRKHWTVGEYEPGIAQKFDLQTCDTTFVEGGTAYVAHCGSGATCNFVAEEVLKAYPELGSPSVHCTLEPPHILESCTGF